ncbi:MAG: choice-of-anchor L domain-containing protein [Deltaproteobacteria bacterium]|nr:choice-of-anchor L domain-containing protein [Deltaproteobacteria bacterium]
MKMRFTFFANRNALLLCLAAATFVGIACSAASNKSLNEGSGSATTAVGGGGAGGTTPTSSQTGIDLSGGNGGSDSGKFCDSGENDDADKDGFTPKQGDCNDCDANVNPNAVEVIGGDDGGGGAGGYVPSDENCDGQVDEAPMPCDGGLALDSMDAMDEARAIGLCKQSKGPNDWGVVSAQWTNLDQTPPPASPNYALGHGILTAFGPNVKVQEGVKMLALSSGTARQPTDPGYQSVSGFSKGYSTPQPIGQFPKESAACPNATTGKANDGASVTLKLRTPSNAQGFRFNFNFFTYEWPVFVCSTFNDFFVAMLDPVPMGLVDGNISFDKNGDPVSVNNAFLEVCGCSGGPPCTAGGKQFTCPLGNAGLVGTGFGADLAFSDHASSGWLETQAPVLPNTEITLQFAVSDSGDGVLDTSVLVDNFRWLAEPGTTVSTNVVPDPK